MAGKRGHRAWGSIKRQRTRAVSYQASFIGPDLRRHYAPHTFTNKMNAEAWLNSEKNYRDHCCATGERWRNVGTVQEKTARNLLFGNYGAKVLEQRKLKESSRSLYQDKWAKLIVPAFADVAVKDMSGRAVRAWFASLDSRFATRNAQAYTVLSMICATAVEDGLLLANPCTIKGATSTTAKPKGEPLSVNDVFAIANWLGSQEKYRQFKYLVLIAAFCGGHPHGEATWPPALGKQQSCGAKTSLCLAMERVGYPRFSRLNVASIIAAAAMSDPPKQKTNAGSISHS